MRQKNIHVRVMPKHSKKTQEAFFRFVKDKNGKFIGSGNMSYNFKNFFYLFEQASIDDDQITDYIKTCIGIFTNKSFYNSKMTSRSLANVLRRCSISYTQKDLSEERVKQLGILLRIYLYEVFDESRKSYGTALSANRQITEWEHNSIM